MEQNSIVQNGDAVLRKTAREVAPELIGGKTLNAQIQQMKNALRREYLGVALAAPQIGISRRMFIVAGKVFSEEGLSDDQIFINPVITKLSKKTKMMDEGCLSVKYHFGQVKRHTNLNVEYYDEHGKRHTRGAGGLLAHIVQHECDHLEGVLFIDKAESCEELIGKDRAYVDRQEKNYLASLEHE